MSALDWYKIRDTLLGHNQTVQNVSLAIDMASKSQHPVALWLTQVMAGQLVVTREDASRVFLERQNDPRSVALGVLVIASSNQSLLKKAADDGDALAQAFMFSLPNGLEYAQKASLQNERDGFFRLAAHFDFRVGDVERAKQNYRRASLLGHVVAMNKYASFLSEEDPDRVMWLSKAALAGVRDDFLASFSEFVRRFKLGRLPPSVMFDIGNALKGMLGSGVIRMGDLKFYDPEKATKEAIEFYELQVDRAKRAVFAWSLVGIRLNLIKDVRVLIAKVVWEMKREGNYEKIAEQRRRSKR